MDGFNFKQGIFAFIGAVVTVSFISIPIKKSADTFQYYISRIIYNIYFHPLAKFPGPTLWAAFRFPYLYSMLQGVVPYRIKALHDQHGPVVRISPNECSYSRGHFSLFQIVPIVERSDLLFLLT
jgi:hypothetical protein